jgi:hypothetical protein
MLLAAMVIAIDAGRAGAQPAEFNLGSSPIGKMIELPSWACGNLVVEDFDLSVPELTVKLNIPDEFYQSRLLAASDEATWKLRQGEVHTARLRNGGFSFYWKEVPLLPNSRFPADVVLVVRKHCPDAGCKSLCDCTVRPRSKRLTVEVTPWASVSWRPFGIVCEGCIPMEWSLPIEVDGTQPLRLNDLEPGEYEFRFESDKFETEVRTVTVPGTRSLTVDLERTGRLKPQLK